MQASYRLAMLGSHLQTLAVPTPEFPMLSTEERSLYDGKTYYASRGTGSGCSVPLSLLNGLNQRNYSHLQTISAAITKVQHLRGIQSTSREYLNNPEGKVHKITKIVREFFGVTVGYVVVDGLLVLEKEFHSWLQEPVYICELLDDRDGEEREGEVVGYEEIASTLDKVKFAPVVVLQHPFTDAKLLVQNIRRLNTSCLVYVHCTDQHNGTIEFSDWNVDGLFYSTESNWAVLISKLQLDTQIDLDPQYFTELEDSLKRRLGDSYVDAEVEELVEV
ncbi:uncharacterized protein CANTADRAFT_26652 [Suhomyces tanzawaensis NRRL Y-17324]|uniref:Uncharacterized protein n=1 Tax=Suhomyces tanzawaensis NRRL Y-17324 TaxID=984487 RepID=A0A1E4SGI3_9ASCO|nr:uncharacterized protein CANTADRAFT_26652 [Suhomyces tanzawaensis NRRL Y-17324]ODV78621.1 hypothetical protein CANTADRAFT_26652 [Suhomyces tanzawaensis NRRL Y-17324]